MKRFIYTFFTRLPAILLLFVFSYTSCSNPFTIIKEKNISTPFDPFNPGEGTPVYSYIDDDGNLSDTDYGKTLFFVEDNEHAEGVFIYSDDTKDDYSCVTFLYEDITITMFFEDDSGFPTSMYIPGPKGNFKGYFSSYNDETQAYNIMIEQDNNYDMLKNISLDKELLTKYQNDPDKTDSQNKRIRNYTTSLCVYYSLYNFFKSNDSTNNVRSARAISIIPDWLKNALSNPAIMFVAVIFFTPVVAVVTAVEIIETGIQNSIDLLNVFVSASKPVEKLFITLEWADDRDTDTVTKPEDLLHFKKNIFEYTIHVEVLSGPWNEDKLNELINASYYAYSPGEEYNPEKAPSSLGYFAFSNGKPYEIIKNDSTYKKFDIKFTRNSSPVTYYETEVRIGLVFQNPLVIKENDNDDNDTYNAVNVKFFGNINNDSNYTYNTSVKPENNPDIDITYSNLLTMRFCLFSYNECPHF